MEDLLGESMTWDLSSDRKLLTWMETFSARVEARSMDLQIRLADLAGQVAAADVSLKTAFNQLEALSRTQFIENRVYEEGVRPADARKGKGLVAMDSSPQVLEEGINERYRQAVQVGWEAIQQALPQAPHGDPRSPAWQEDAAKPLPHVIGTPEFSFDNSCGLGEAGPEDYAILPGGMQKFMQGGGPLRGQASAQPLGSMESSMSEASWSESEEEDIAHEVTTLPEDPWSSDEEEMGTEGWGNGATKNAPRGALDSVSVPPSQRDVAQLSSDVEPAVLAAEGFRAMLEAALRGPNDFYDDLDPAMGVYNLPRAHVEGDVTLVDDYVGSLPPSAEPATSAARGTAEGAGHKRERHLPEGAPQPVVSSPPVRVLVPELTESRSAQRGRQEGALVPAGILSGASRLADVKSESSLTNDAQLKHQQGEAEEEEEEDIFGKSSDVKEQSTPSYATSYGSLMRSRLPGNTGSLFDPGGAKAGLFRTAGDAGGSKGGLFEDEDEEDLFGQNDLYRRGSAGGSGGEVPRGDHRESTPKDMLLPVASEQSIPPARIPSPPDGVANLNHLYSRGGLFDDLEDEEEEEVVKSGALRSAESQPPLSAEPLEATDGVEDQRGSRVRLTNDTKMAAVSAGSLFEGEDLFSGDDDSHSPPLQLNVHSNQNWLAEEGADVVAKREIPTVRRGLFDDDDDEGEEIGVHDDEPLAKGESTNEFEFLPGPATILRKGQEYAVQNGLDSSFVPLGQSRSPPASFQPLKTGGLFSDDEDDSWESDKMDKSQTALDAAVSDPLPSTAHDRDEAPLHLGSVAFLGRGRLQPQLPASDTNNHSKHTRSFGEGLFNFEEEGKTYGSSSGPEQAAASPRADVSIPKPSRQKAEPDGAGLFAANDSSLFVSKGPPVAAPAVPSGPGLVLGSSLSPVQRMTASLTAGRRHLGETDSDSEWEDNDDAHSPTGNATPAGAATGSWLRGHATVSRTNEEVPGGSKAFPQHVPSSPLPERKEGHGARDSAVPTSWLSSQGTLTPITALLGDEEEGGEEEDLFGSIAAVPKKDMVSSHASLFADVDSDSDSEFSPGSEASRRILDQAPAGSKKGKSALPRRSHSLFGNDEDGNDDFG